MILIVKSLQKEQNSTNLLLWPPICRNKPAITPKWFNSLDTNSNWKAKQQNVDFPSIILWVELGISEVMKIPLPNLNDRIFNLIGMSYDSKKNAHLQHHLAWHASNEPDWCQFFPPKNVDKIQLTKSGQKMTRGWKVHSLMPIRVQLIKKGVMGKPLLPSTSSR